MFKNKKIKGFTLVELLLGVGLIAMGTGAIYVLNDITGHSNDAFQESQRLISYSKTASSIISSSGDYSAINIEFLENYGISVDKKLGLNKIVSPTPSSLSFEYEGIDSKFCTKFVANLLSTGSNFKIAVNDTELSNKEEIIADTASLCAQENSKISITQSIDVALGTITNESLVPAYDYNSGNPGTISNAGLNPLSSVPIISGQSSSSFVKASDGTGFNGGGGYNPPGSVAPPTNNRLPPNFSNAGSDLNIPSTPLPPGRVSSAAIDFKVDTSSVINVQSFNMNIVVGGLYPYSRYRLEFGSQAFSLVNNNPVTLGGMSGSNGLIDELTIGFEANGFGGINYSTSELFNVSHYFRRAIGTDGNGQPITDPNEPMNASLKDYFTNTIKNYPMTVDVIANENEKVVTSFDFMPVWHMDSPFITNLRKYQLSGTSFSIMCYGCEGGNLFPTVSEAELVTPYRNDWVMSLSQYPFVLPGDPFIEFKTQQDWLDFTGEGYRIYYKFYTEMGNSSRRTFNYLVCKLPQVAYSDPNYVGYVTCR